MLIYFTLITHLVTYMVIYLTLITYLVMICLFILH